MPYGLITGLSNRVQQPVQNVRVLPFLTVILPRGAAPDRRCQPVEKSVQPRRFQSSPARHADMFLICCRDRPQTLFHNFLFDFNRFALFCPHTQAQQVHTDCTLLIQNCKDTGFYVQCISGLTVRSRLLNS